MTAVRAASEAPTTTGSERTELRRAPRTSGPVLVAIGGALATPATSSARSIDTFAVDAGTRASAGPLGPLRDREATSRAVSELRRIGGLTWDQLAQLFGVSRRAVHFWASGKPLNAENEARLLRVLDVVRYADRGDSRSTRAALLEAHRGKAPLQLLTEQRFTEARKLLGKGEGSAIPRPRGELSPQARAARKPLPPEELVGAQHEPIHRDRGPGRAARTVRNRRRGRSG